MDEEGLIAEVPELEGEASAPRVVASHEPGDGLVISTAFIPVCIRGEDGRPSCFETVVVRGHKSKVVRRYSDLHEALTGHDSVVADYA